MFKYIVFASLLAICTAASIKATIEEKPIVPILNQGEEKNSDGSFAYYFEGGDGSKRQESAYIKNLGTEDEALVVKGSYRYIDANGEEILVEYIADENGFQPLGNIIPKEISQIAADAAVQSNLERSLQKSS
ncbi:endocuticle structural protein SgAbd-6-like [Haematobia irritans]|uniref:endocuticle structural protein SgAbd-6-like n=1 Tax=Haematobia irritans TaxID=7368 RepID=UPI003F4F9D4C